MNFRYVAFIFFAVISSFCFGQTFGPKQIINPEPSTVRMIRTADFDNDNDIDIVVAAFDFITWYRNDGHGNFSTPIVIQEGMLQSFSLTPTDLNGDDDIDLVVSYFDDGIIAWYRNEGEGNFGELREITSGSIGIYNGVVAEDLDGDDDNDIVLGIGNGNGLYWYENTAGNGFFWDEHIIDVGISEARIQDVGDIDGDSDIDILTNGSNGGTRISWYENTDGLGTFGNQTAIDITGFYEIAVYLVDIDGDNDLDTVSPKDEFIVWRENLDGFGNFGPTQIISDQVDGAYDVAIGDFDKDNDIDIASVSVGDEDKVAWYENTDGLGNFGAQEIIDLTLISPRTIHAADLDGDGDLDLVSAALEPGDGSRELVWYENLTILNTQDFNILDVKMYPNPAKEVLRIDSPAEITTITIYNTMGIKLKEVTQNTSEISLVGIPTGLLFIKIATEQGTVIQKVIKQ